MADKFTMEAQLKLNTRNAERSLQQIQKETKSGIGGAVTAGAVGGAVAGAAVAGIPIILDTLSKSFQTLQNMLGKIIQLLTLILKPIELMLVAFLMPLFTALMPLVRILLRLFMPFIRAFIQQIKERRGLIEASGGALLPAVYAEAATSGIVALLEPVLDVLIDIGYFVSATFLPVLQTFMGLVADIADAFFKAIGITTNFRGIVDEVFGGLIASLPTIRDFLKAEIDLIAGHIQEIPEEIKLALGAMKEEGGVAAILASIMADMATTTEHIFGSASQEAIADLTNLKDALIGEGGALSSLAEQGKFLMTNMGADINAALLDLSYLVNTDIIPTIEKITSSMTSLKKAIDAIITPITSLIDQLLRAPTGAETAATQYYNQPITAGTLAQTGIQGGVTVNVNSPTFADNAAVREFSRTLADEVEWQRTGVMKYYGL